jgi:hypothetical protein
LHFFSRATSIPAKEACPHCTAASLNPLAGRRKCVADHPAEDATI